LETAATSGRRVTIKDIAAELGVSHSTVSRALAGHPNISPAVRASVGSAAKSAGYVANTAARLMRGGSSSFVALVIPELQDEWDSAIAKTFAECCNAASMQMVLAVTEDDPTIEYQHVRAICEAKVAGALIIPARSPKRATTQLLKDLPVLQLVRRVRSLATDCVLTDDEGGLFAAAQHLLDLGHRSIGYIGLDIGLSTGAERLAGVRKALSQAGIDISQAPVEIGPPRADFGRQALPRLISAATRPTAIIAGSSHLTLGAIEAIQSLKLRVPQDISLVGYGDPPWFKLWGRGITTLSLPVHEIVVTASAALLQRIRGPAADRPRSEGYVLTKHAPLLVVRGSTSPPKG
jgi:DNA-binding LacI/PurR family transcriptional regulator